jgi:hypothetical protein
MSKAITTVTDRSGREVEVVTRPNRKRGMRPMFGGPESVIGAGVQKNLDATVLDDMFAKVQFADLRTRKKNG